MKLKICSKCKIKKSLKEFYKSNKTNDNLQYKCKICSKKLCKNWYNNNKQKFKNYSKKYYEKNKNKCIKASVKAFQKRKPWEKTWVYIHVRCDLKSQKNYKQYGEKGIKNLITKEELKKLWFRDKGYKMNKPSIDRKNSKGNYTFNNCRYIELNLNRKLVRQTKFFSIKQAIKNLKNIRNKENIKIQLIIYKV